MINISLVGKYRLLLFGDLQKVKKKKNKSKKKIWHLECVVNIGPYGAGNFKTLLLLQFSSVMLVKLYEGIAYHGVRQAITFLGIRLNFTKINAF